MRWLLTLLLTAALSVMIAFAWFIQSLPTEETPTSIRTDAIIVLTGGNGRVERGLVLLSQGAAPVLFISGAGAHVTLPQMIAAHSSRAVRDAIAARGGDIVLDYVADSTQANASEATMFVAARGIHSIRLITAHYHMPRSLLEFRAAMPGVTIIADPVFPEGFRRNEWWQHEASRRLVFSEFQKYFGALFLQMAHQR